MKTVFQTNFSVEAHMVRHLLQSAGLEAQILGEFLVGGAGELPAGGLVRVVVADEIEDEARELIAEWEKSEPEATSLPTGQ